MQLTKRGVILLAFVILAGIAIFAEYSEITRHLSPLKQFVVTDNTAAVSISVSGVSGAIFKMDEKRRRYTGERDINSLNSIGVRKLVNNYESECKSENWIVVTTIFEPTQAIKDFNSIPQWCTVIIADKKSVASEAYNKELNTSAVIYLSVADQHKMFRHFPIYEIIPFNHFGRKNLGYFYAILNGAKYIYDTDDDNVVVTPYKTLGIPIVRSLSDERMEIKTFRDARMTDAHTFNIFKLFAQGANEEIWPRGFDLTVLRESFDWHSEVKLTAVTNTNNNNAYIIQQWLANIEPDFDAIGRLMGRNKPANPSKYQFSSDSNKQFAVEIPNSIYIPSNAQMSVWESRSFLLIYLPITVHGRVSDIWRGYIAQSVMHLLSANVESIHWKLLYCPVLVDQYRNEHSNLADFSSEIPVYLQTNALLTFLNKFANEYDLNKVTTDRRINIAQIVLDLYIELYEYGIVQIKDVKGIYAWINSFKYDPFILLK